MLHETREAWEAYTRQMAQVNGVRDVSKKFTVDPSVQQTLETKIQESSGFLSAINIFGVPELQGEKIGLEVNSTIAGRTDTSGAGRRQTQDPTGLDSTGYQLKQTNFDTHLGYGKLDVWAKFADFQTRIQAAIMLRCALDRIMIGWNGTSAAATTNRVANPLLQDVNIGWLQHMRTDNAERVMDEGASAGVITVGPGGDYKNIDALVYDAIYSLLPSWQRERQDLVAICGSDLLHDKYFRLVNKEQAPTEQLATDIIMSSKRLGNRQAASVPYFVPNAILVTPLKNLSIYYQDGKRRRTIREAPDADRVEDFQSSNEGYVIEDYEAACLIENIQLITPDDD
ncbi:phage major capsid protein, P2 family [Flavisphingomonas formosensis]|uniref:phage major capsid protein, P2 family n=1 Tax=Flavisphingomonas formosensis TaxID=861534 RepID=UPI0012FA672D|nr:phage major capsid protein, P2 family [Sphingomonas formosensis]